MKIMLKHVLVMMLLAPRALVWGASKPPTSGNGLEVDSTTPLNVIIEEVSEEEKKIGLKRTNRGSRQSIAAKGGNNSTVKGLRSKREEWSSLSERYCYR